MVNKINSHSLADGCLPFFRPHFLLYRHNSTWKRISCMPRSQRQMRTWSTHSIYGNSISCLYYLNALCKQSTHKIVSQINGYKFNNILYFTFLVNLSYYTSSRIIHRIYILAYSAKILIRPTFSIVPIYIDM